MLSFTGFTAVRHYWLICCLIILFVLLLFLLLLLCPLYILTNTNSNDNANNNTSMLRNGAFQTQNCNKLSENPNSQQQEMPQPQTLYDCRGSVDCNIGGVGDGSLVDHNNLTKSRIVGGSAYKIRTNFVTADRKSIGDNERIRNNRSGKQVKSGVYSKLNIDREYIASENLLKKRNRRVIIFSGGGIIKFVMSVSFPISLGDKQRSLSHFYNLQCQYPPPTRPIYWWNYFNSSTFAARRQQRHLKNDQKRRLHHRLKHDASREFFYAAIEQIYERHGIPGESCLLQAICEVSQMPLHVPRLWENKLVHLWHALINAVLIPTVPNVAIKYLHASQAGRFGADCQQAFNDCPQRINEWLRYLAHTAY